MCADCLFLNRPCPHGRHTHARDLDDDSCFQFLRLQVQHETAPASDRAIVRDAGVYGLSDGYLNESGEHDSRVARARAGSLGATLAHRDGLPHEARYPGLASVISDAMHAGPTREWLRLALIEAICPLPPHGTRAINATARRVCRNELPLRYRADLVAIAS